MINFVKLPVALAFSILSFISCKNAAEKEVQVNDRSSSSTVTEPLSESTATNYCFLSTLKKDSTFVNLSIEGNSVTGTMAWQPYEKDAARGTLSGKTNSNGEFELLYDYMIEGSKQTETKIMKIENGKLRIKTGELNDPKNDGNLVFKDASKTAYTEILNKVDCK